MQRQDTSISSTYNMWVEVQLYVGYITIECDMKLTMQTVQQSKTNAVTFKVLLKRSYLWCSLQVKYGFKRDVRVVEVYKLIGVAI